MAIRRVTFEEITKGSLYSDLIVPSHSHAYNVAVQYVKEWFLEKCPKNFFKEESIYVDGSYIFSDMAKMTRAEMLKRPSPNLTIIPELDYQFNNEYIDLNSTKLKTYIKRSGYDRAFFIDYEKDMRIGINFEVLKLNTQYRIKVKTKSMQLDTYQRLKLALGQTSGEEICTDVHIPFELVMQVAYHAGFKVDTENKKIYELDKFLAYLNGHSAIPFIYKLRYVNGREEFFIRVNDMYVHTKVTDISIDNGERTGQLMSNFTIEVNTETRFPAPQVYVLYSLQENKLVGVPVDDKEYDFRTFINTFRIGYLPDVNEKGWNKYLNTEIVERDLTKPISINFMPLFEGADAGRVMEYTKSIKISPATFIDIKIFNKGKELPTKIDWETMDVTCTELHEDPVSSTIIYLDTNYMNTTLVNLDEAMKNRLS